MHPAYSVIFFTTASGAGYGLLALLGATAPTGTLGPRFPVAALGLAFALIAAGLLSSTFHLGHPERAWRAFTQWRSSWLSREGVMSMLTFLPFAVFAYGWIVLGETEGLWRAAGAAVALSAILTIYCTAMIYRCLKPVRHWW